MTVNVNEQLRDRQFNPVATLDGNIVGRSAPDWWLRHSINNADGVNTVFAPMRVGNKVSFFTTGEDYFKNVAQAIKSATRSVFIAGWQVNFDVRLVGEERLWDCLDKAIEGGANVYVMPWMSPKAPGFNTGDFDTMLAVFQLNAGRNGPRKAFVMPAMQQSDMGSQALGFAHHQKLVVIDNQIAYVGGMDLAYGRHDNNSFSLKVGTRQGRERYNPCIPPAYKMSSVEQAAYLTTGELFHHAWNPYPDVASHGSRAFSAMLEFLQVGAAERAVTNVGDKVAKDYVKPLTLKVWNKAAGVAVKAGKGAVGQLPEELQRRLALLARTGSAATFNRGEAIAAFLMNYSTEGKTPEENRWLQDTAMSLMVASHGVLMRTTDWQPLRMHALKAGRQMLPRDGAMLDADTQPRMPWQDVHSRMEGPAVFDLATNFINRWNSLCLPLSELAKRASQLLSGANSPELQALGRAAEAGALEEFIGTQHRPVFDPAVKGSCRVQTLRSAPKQLQLDEINAAKHVAPAGRAQVRVVEPVRFGRDGKQLPAREPGPVKEPQTNCMDAMVKVIRSAQNFIYIEGQFFQSEHGRVNDVSADLSGPMASLIDLASVPGYSEYAQRCNLKQAVKDRDISKIDWQAAVEIPSQEFIEGLTRVAKNWGTVQFSLFPFTEPPQGSLINTIGAELVERAACAVRDRRPFHIYMVLPVHPEGQLDSIFVLSQMHWTMQSLVNGEKSLVNRLRRVAKTREYWKDTGFSPARYSECERKAQLLPVKSLSGDDGWRDFLTLLNLRNWDTIGGRAVTEQIYVHSKLLIVDDRVAVLGSANLNDRSLLGSRDSEVAITVHDDTSIKKPITGGEAIDVSEVVHKLRVDLWKKHFGITSGVRAASELEAFLDKPAFEGTWKAIQRRANANLGIYSNTFPFVPRNSSAIQPARPASIWPVWRYPEGMDANGSPISFGGQQEGLMPFQSEFWDKESAEKFRPGELNNVRGFIVSFPTAWSRFENINSGANLTVLARLLTTPELEGNLQARATRSNVDKEATG